MPPNGFNLFRTAEDWTVHISSEPVMTFMCHRNENINNGSQWKAKTIGPRYAVFREGHWLVFLLHTYERNSHLYFAEQISLSLFM
jgi:hypothetical protein